MISAKELAQAGAEMRRLQRAYFKTAIAARRENHPDLLAQKRKLLDQSKAAEARFDKMIKAALNPEPPKLFN